MLLTLRLCLAALFAASACNQTSVTEQLKPLQLLHFSDLHGSALHLQRIVEYMDSHDVDDAIHTGDGVMCYYDDANVFESVPGGRRVLNAIGNHDCWKGHLLWSQTDKPYDATKEEAYSRFFVGPDPRHPTIAEWKVCQPEGVNDVQSPDYQACYYYKDYSKFNIHHYLKDSDYKRALDSLLIDEIRMEHTNGTIPWSLHL